MAFLPILSGFGVGLIVGLTGVGGGSLMTPLLISAFHVDKAVAIGTDLWFACLTKLSGALAHHRAGNVDYRIVSLLLAGSVPGTLATVSYMKWIGLSKRTDGVLTVALGVALLLTAVTIAFRPVWLRIGIRLERWITPSMRPPLTVLSGLVLGVLVSLSSIGAGAIGATMILLLYPRLEMRKLVGIDIAHAVPLTLVAGIGHASLGTVNWSLLAQLLVGSVPGIWLGSHMTKTLPERYTRIALCTALVFAASAVLRT
jgi:uncharacterized membrane protein YfcA